MGTFKPFCTEEQATKQIFGLKSKHVMNASVNLEPKFEIYIK